jgi:hypothetical protein
VELSLIATLITIDTVGIYRHEAHVTHLQHGRLLDGHVLHALPVHADEALRHAARLEQHRGAPGPPRDGQRAPLVLEIQAQPDHSDNSMAGGCISCTWMLSSSRSLIARMYGAAEPASAHANPPPMCLRERERSRKVNLPCCSSRVARVAAGWLARVHRSRHSRWLRASRELHGAVPCIASVTRP